MVFESIFGEEREEEREEFIEIRPEGEDRRKINIRIENLNNYRDVERIQKHLREGNIIFLRMGQMRKRDIGELKRCIGRLRRTSVAMNGDIIGIDENFLILTPPYAKIYRGEAETPKVETE